MACLPEKLDAAIEREQYARPPPLHFALAFDFDAHSRILLPCCDKLQITAARKRSDARAEEVDGNRG